MKTPECKSCVAAGVKTWRPVTKPGPRCATHQRVAVRATKYRAWARYLLATYQLTDVQYWVMYDRQGGRCAICPRANGRTRHLSVDHDHRCCRGSASCGQCVRGLVCGPCNTMLGRMADAPTVFLSAARYLADYDHRVATRGGRNMRAL